ncbi:hypothetical protein BU17DRAFT_80754 [Hysterangium stoloniferum]|nr:hypothetical protein BU17DRAFT_80754 [Hysterangium stoloniferum]
MSSDQLPIAQLESLKFRATQIMESITALQFLIDNGAHAMPPWPDILARYSILLSQTHSLFGFLSPAPPSSMRNEQPAPTNIFQKLALHPKISLTEHQLDHALAPLLRNQPTVQVLKGEDATVRRLAAVLKSATSEGVPVVAGPEGCQQVVQECAQIRSEHDARVERAVKAVALLKDRYEWKARVEAGDEDFEDEELGEVGVDNNGDVPMGVPTPEPLVKFNGRSSEASTPASARSDEENEARVTEDVLGEMGLPG